MAGPGILSSPLPITLLAPFTPFPLGPQFPSSLQLPGWKMPPPSPGTCTLEQNKEGKLKITESSQQSSLVGFPHVQPPQQPVHVSARVWV